MIVCHRTDAHEDQYLYKQFMHSSLILKCICNTLMGLPRTSWVATVWKCYFKQSQHFILHVRLMTTGNKDEYNAALTRNNLKNIAIDLCTMTYWNFMSFQSPYYSYLFPLQCKTEMALNRLLLKKVIQESNMYIGNDKIIVFFDNDI